LSDCRGYRSDKEVALAAAYSVLTAGSVGQKYEGEVVGLDVLGKPDPTPAPARLVITLDLRAVTF
jgi:hypothetical protein